MSNKANVPLDPCRAIAKMLSRLDDEDKDTFNWLLAAHHHVKTHYATTMSDKNTEDCGGGCSICHQMPAVNVYGTYWLCGSCTSDQIEHCSGDSGTGFRKYTIVHTQIGTVPKFERVETSDLAKLLNEKYDSAWFVFLGWPKLEGEAP